MNGVGSVLGIAEKIIDKVGDIFPSKAEKDQAKARLMELQQKGELADIELSMQVLLAEAKSADSFTSRARPTFMYVFYLILLCAVPMGILYGINPGLAENITNGMLSWWGALPTELWWTFGVGFTGYTTFRSIDKAGLIKNKKKLGL